VRHGTLVAIGLWAMVMASVVAASGQQRPAAAPGGPSSDAASIAGRLLDADTGQPIPGGVLVVRELANRDQRVVQANETGAFLVEDLPAASYSLHASALGYVGRQYGQRHTLEEGVPIVLRPGEARREIDVALLPGGVITGRVTTRGGQPLAFAEVEALRPQLESQLRVLLPIGRAESNERGDFRIVGLPPGRYYVAAIDPTDEGTEDVAGQIHWAQTFYPGVTSPAAAERINLASGQTLANIDFPLLGVTRVSVRGRLLSGSGNELATGSVIMSPESEEGLGLGMAQAAVVRPDGSFEFASVSPGDYRLRASARTVQPGPALFASFVLSVAGVDVSNALLFLNPGASLFGQVEVAADAASPPPTLTDLWVSAPMANGSMGSGLTRSQVLSDGDFSLSTPDGDRVVRVEGMPDPWSLEAVIYQGRDVIDIPFNLGTGEERERIRLVLTDRPSRLSGTVQDEAGNAVTDRAIVALPINSTFWHPGSRHIQLTYPDLAGRYEMIGLPAGGGTSWRPSRRS